MAGRNTMKLTAALALATFAVPAAAQNAQPTSPTPDQVQEWVDEATRIQQRLAPLQQQVLGESEFAEERLELARQLELAMMEADPQLQQDLAAARDLEPRMEQAQQAGNQAALQQLVEQARALEARYMAAQEAALEDEELTTIVLAFNQRVEARMIEIEPEAAELIERLEQLRESIEGLQGAAN